MNYTLFVTSLCKNTKYYPKDNAYLIKKGPPQ